jgi:hypothetical protein
MPARQPIPPGGDEITDVLVGVVGQEILDTTIGGDVRRASRRSWSVVFDSALVAYFGALRMAAQACGTPESTALLPGMIAQPPFST